MTKQAKTNIAVLISGRGSNLACLIKAVTAPDYPAQITLVISNKPTAKGLDIAAKAGLTTLTIDHTKFATREAFDETLDKALQTHKIDLICHAGFMRLLGESFCTKWDKKQLNIHPSLLPSFKGTNVHKRVLEAGVKITGCTVHQVTLEMDAGAILGQAAVPILKDDTVQSLEQRVLEAEHKLYAPMIKHYIEHHLSPIQRDEKPKTIDKNQRILFSPLLSCND